MVRVRVCACAACVRLPAAGDGFPAHVWNPFDPSSERKSTEIFAGPVAKRVRNDKSNSHPVETNPFGPLDLSKLLRRQLAFTSEKRQEAVNLRKSCSPDTHTHRHTDTGPSYKKSNDRTQPQEQLRGGCVIREDERERETNQ